MKDSPPTNRIVDYNRENGVGLRNSYGTVPETNFNIAGDNANIGVSFSVDRGYIDFDSNAETNAVFDMNERHDENRDDAMTAYLDRNEFDGDVNNLEDRTQFAANNEGDETTFNEDGEEKEAEPDDDLNAQANGLNTGYNYGSNNNFLFDGRRRIEVLADRSSVIEGNNFVMPNIEQSLTQRILLLQQADQAGVVAPPLIAGPDQVILQIDTYHHPADPPSVAFEELGHDLGLFDEVFGGGINSRTLPMPAASNSIRIVNDNDILIDEDGTAGLTKEQVGGAALVAGAAAVAGNLINDKQVAPNLPSIGLPPVGGSSGDATSQGEKRPFQEVELFNEPELLPNYGLEADVKMWLRQYRDNSGSVKFNPNNLLHVAWALKESKKRRVALPREKTVLGYPRLLPREYFKDKIKPLFKSGLKKMGKPDIRLRELPKTHISPFDRF